MFGSIRLGRALGIDLFVHGSFWLLPAFIFLSGVAAGRGDELALDLAVLFATFGCVALHELGHAVAASWYGVRTRDITLYPLGGVARLESVPDRPWPEIVIALAGPAVNVGIAVVLAALMVADGYSLAPTESAGDPGFMEAFAGRLLLTNVILVLFNLLPAFPMDGGRVLRAVFALFVNRVSATHAAVTIGSVAAGLMVIAGLTSGNLILALVGGMVFMMGRAELAAVRQQAARESTRRWPAANDWYEQDVPLVRPRVPVARPLDGWVWDAARQDWTEWRGGFPVRRGPMG